MWTKRKAAGRMKSDPGSGSDGMLARHSESHPLFSLFRSVAPSNHNVVNVEAMAAAHENVRFCYCASRILRYHKIHPETIELCGMPDKAGPAYFNIGHFPPEISY